MVLVLMIVAGTLIAGATNALAGTYCSTDPTVGAGTPYTTWSATGSVDGTKVYASGTSSSTTFGGGVYIP